MKISDFLDDKTIITNLRARDKISALREITGILYKDGKIKDREIVFKALLEKGAIDVTVQGVAFPNARIDGLKEPVALLAISHHGINFNTKVLPTSFSFF